MSRRRCRADSTPIGWVNALLVDAHTYAQIPCRRIAPCRGSGTGVDVALAGSAYEQRPRPRAAPRKVPAQANAAWAALHYVRRVRRRRAVLPRGRAWLAVRRVPAAAPSRSGLTPPPSRGSVRTSAAPLIGLLA